jgi:hypothetical protein
VRQVDAMVEYQVGLQAAVREERPAGQLGQRVAMSGHGISQVTPENGERMQAVREPASVDRRA